MADATQKRRATTTGAFLVFVAWLPAAMAAETKFERSIEPSRNETAVARTGTVRLSLADAVYLALRYNRTLESADIARVAQRFDLRVVEDKFTPHAVLQGSAQMSKTLRRERITYATNIQPGVNWVSPLGTQVNFAFTQPTSRRAGDTPGVSSSFDATLTQPLLKGFGLDVNTADIAIARFNERSNRQALRDQTIATITQTVVAFRAVTQAKAQIAIADDALVRSRQLLDVNRQLVSAGRMASMEMVQTEASIASQELAALQARNAYDGVVLQLLSVLALDEASSIETIDEPAPERVAINPERALGIAYAARGDLQRALLAREVAKLNLMLAENNALWEVNLFGTGRVSGAGRTRNDSLRTLGDEVRGYTAGLQVRIPLNDLSLEQRVVGGKVSLRQSELQLADARRTVELSVQDATRNVDVAWRVYELASKSVDLSNQKLRVEREKLAVGRSSNFQVLSYETDLLNARTQLLSARISYSNALTALDQVLGSSLDTWQVRIRD